MALWFISYVSLKRSLSTPGSSHVKVKVTQSCLTLWDPMEYTMHGILQARILEWEAYPFSKGSSQSRNQSRVFYIAGGFFYQLSHQGSQLKMTEGQLSEQIRACLSSSGFTISIKAIGFYIRVPFLSIQSVNFIAFWNFTLQCLLCTSG